MMGDELLDRVLERAIVPDCVLRAGSRLGHGARLRRERRGGVATQEQRLQELIAASRTGPIAEQVEAPNAQHYEVPSDFFSLMLGPWHKYSCALWPPGITGLGPAEEAMLALTCARAGIRDGMEVLDLGCGWGALSLWIASHYDVRVLAVSNSAVQRAHIERECARRGISDIEVLTIDVNQLALDRRFDRVVSVEMFEHIRNWDALLARTAALLKPDGSAFIHIFSHRTLAYRFTDTWAARNFFTAGTMPSHDMLLHFNRDLTVVERWAVSGVHYARTIKAWLVNLDANAERAAAIVGARQFARWRLMLLGSAEMWARRRGEEWIVSHYLLRPRA
jgi:cyclopropane-fatty-acyl-phospholipid synthase